MVAKNHKLCNSNLFLKRFCLTNTENIGVSHLRHPTATALLHALPAGTFPKGCHKPEGGDRLKRDPALLTTTHPILRGPGTCP